MNKPSKFLFLALLIPGAIFLISPFLQKATKLYTERLDATEIIFLGNPIACDNFKTKLSHASAADKKDILTQVLKIISMPAQEFQKKSEDKESLRNWLGNQKDDSFVSQGGQDFSQRCLYELLSFFPEEMESIVDQLFNSDRAKSSNVQMKAALQSFIEIQCKGNIKCLKPLKDHMTKEDSQFTQQYANTLASIDGGALSLLEAFDTIPDDKLGSSDSPTPSRHKASLILSSIITALPESQKAAKEEIRKRLDNSQYSSIKKAIITANYSVDMDYQSTGGEIQVVEALNIGTRLQKDFQSQQTKSIEPLTAWLISIDKIDAKDMSGKEKEQLTNLLDFFVKWALNNLGMNSGVINHIILTSTFTDKLKLPMSSAEELARNSQFSIAGQKLLLLESPLPVNREKVFLDNYEKLNFNDKAEILRFATEKVNTKAPQPTDLIFKMGLNLKYHEYQNLLPGGTNKDELLLHWKNYANSVGRKLNEDELVRYFIISKNPDLLSSLSSIWIEVVCTSTRLEYISGVMGSITSWKSFEDSMIKHLKCAEQSELKKDAMNIFSLIKYNDEKSRFQDLVKKESSLSKSIKDEFAQFMQKEGE